MGDISRKFCSLKSSELTKSMFAALFKTFGTIGQPYFLTMLLLPIVVTAIAFGVFFLAVGYALTATALVSTGWLDTVIDWVAGLGTLVLAWFLFPALLPLVASIFQEQMAGRIETQEYGLQEPSALPVSQEVVAGAKFAGYSLFLNVIILPLYLIPPLIPVIYYGLNSYLLGREFFESVAGRRIGRQQAMALRRANRLPVLCAGLMTALSATLPLATLIAPFIGIVVTVHLVQALMPEQDDGSSTERGDMPPS